jgi:Peptidase M50B-like
MATSSGKAARPRRRSGKLFSGRVTGDQRAALVLAAAALAAILVWLPWGRALAYPFRLLVTLVHELSHGLTALATGGHFRNFVVFSDGSGLAYTAGGWRLLVIPAGYLGAAAFGAALILLGTSLKASRWALGALGAVVGLLSLRYGLPSVFHEHAMAGLLAAGSGAALGTVFVWVSARAADRWIVFTVHLVAFLSGFNAFSDLWYLIGISRSPCALATDARSMADLTILPATAWAVVWALCSGLILGLAVRAAWSRGAV